MAVPWLGLIDTMLDLTSLALSSRKTRRASGAAELESLQVSDTPSGRLEARLAGVAVAALKEAFDRDASRLQLEREHLEQERARAERLVKLDLLRQAGDREIARLRLLAGVAVGSWVGTLLLAARTLDGAAGARTLLGVGWLFLLAALSLSFAAQSRVGRTLALVDEARVASMDVDDLTGGTAGALAPWLVVTGLAVIGFGVLIA